MPTYEFRCSDPECAYQYEDFQSMSLPPPNCPKCGKPTVKVPAFRGAVIGDTPKFYK